MVRRTFHLARPSGKFPTIKQESHGRQQFQPLPPPTGSKPYRLLLEDILPSDEISKINASGSISFHAIGDTGGIVNGTPQQTVADAMETDASKSGTAFFYHLGDVVYFYGEASNYYAQFYEPYMHYPGPILAIPGNHDGDVMDGGVPSLAAFVENFCATKPHLTPEAGESPRDAMTQPNVYWTLEAPFVTIIGLYSNVPEGGQFEQGQIDWFRGELADAPKDKALIVSVHHPAYSADNEHGGSSTIEQVLDDAFSSSGRSADLVLTGHVHNYQRFIRQFNGKDITYIVAGSGGYHNLHKLNPYYGNSISLPFRMPNVDGLTLENYCVDHFGFMGLQVTQDAILGKYYTVPNAGDDWSEQYKTVDTFQIDRSALT
ncbi:MAG TPA: metallophosphoesterase [Candidatus Nitrosotalea sp.]|nr:metallophosphoesterase [Candidatus Nitrosotalea sp.]